MAKVQDGKKYIVMNVETKTVFDVDGGRLNSAIQGFNLRFKDVEGHKNKIWMAHSEEPDDKKWWSFTNFNTGEAFRARTDKGKGGQLWSDPYRKEERAQHWYLKQFEGTPSIPCFRMWNRAFLENFGGAWVADLDAGSGGDRTRIQMWPVEGDDNEHQIWMFIEVQ